MKNTNPIFSLKNFRSFGEKGADFELAPITVLTGCNSAGKSSMVKALLLLNKMPQNRFEKTPELKVYSKELGLGKFDKILNHQSKDGIMVFSYKIWSGYLQETVIVKKIFCENMQDVLNTGSMVEYSIEKFDGTMIYKAQAPFEYYSHDQDSRPYRELPGEKNIESIASNFKNFSLVSEFLNMMITSETDRDGYYHYFFNNDDIKREHMIACLKEDQEKLDIIKKQLLDTNIEVDSYDISQIWEWMNWIHRRNHLFDILLKGGIEEDEIKNDYPEKEVIEGYLSRVIEEVFSPWFTQKVDYLDSSSALIKRVYSADENNKMNIALRQQTKLHQTYDEIQKGWENDLYTPGSFLNQWVKKFGIGDKIEIVGDEEGGMKVYIIKNNTKILLADEGYGVTQLASLLLNIDNQIQIKVGQKVSKWKYSLEKMALWNFSDPYVDDEIDTMIIKDYYIRPNRVICVEEPENHLHPKYQSLLADMFVEAYQKYNIHFIIETHSEYLIRKLQVLVADKENKLTPNDVSLNYVDKDEDGISTNRKIDILEDGRLSEPFGPGFFDEADSLAMDLMKYKVRR